VGWTRQLRGKTVGLDTAPLIYYIEENPTYLITVDALFQALDRGEFAAVTSMVTLLEVLVRPFRRGDTALANHYRTILFESAGLTTAPLSQAIAEEAARLRSVYRIGTADAIQMATAACHGASFFVTNDARLPVVPGLTMLTLDELRAET